jgi:penicillin-binding protein 2
MRQYEDRKLTITLIFLSVFIIFAIRLFYVQVLNSDYKVSANNNVLRFMTEYPTRGLIYDRKGKLLVYNEAAYDLMVIPKQVKNLDTTDLCEILGIDKQVFIERMNKIKAYSRYKVSPFEKQISIETYARLQEKLYKFHGFFVQARTLRKYPQKIAAHVLGYIGEVNDKIVKENPYYKDGDYIGISGIEQSYEKELRGKKGMKVVMVDVFNNIKGSFQNGKYDTAAIAGQNIISTLDADLQAYGERLMQGKVGGIVALEPKTGELLAVISSPTYDPNLLVGRVRSKNYSQLLKAEHKPLFNRALMAYYPPGSTFKLINALIAEQEKVINRSTTFPCARGWPVMGGRPKCHPHPSPLDLPGSVQNSCNSYYAFTFRAIMQNPKYRNTEEAFASWRNYVLSFGIGTRLNTDLHQELKGRVPTIEYYNKYFGKGRWNAYTIISLSIGQGELGITPLQMANIMAIIANKGYYYTPHIIKAVGDKKYLKKEFQTKHYTKIDPKYFEPIIEGMSKVVQGTATNAKVEGITIAGKTGTAQNPHGKDHSLFVCFAPAEDPKIAIGIMVENAGFGNTYAAPIASLMVEKYLRDSISRPELEKRMLEANLYSTMFIKETPKKEKPIIKKKNN